MARKTLILDDIDTKQEAAGTITFALGTTIYEIDLAQPNIDKLNTLLAPFIAAGRVVDSRVGAKRFTGSTPYSAMLAPVSNTPTQEPDSSEVRAWALENGFSVEPKGRVPQNITEAYKAAKAKEAAEQSAGVPA